MTDRSEPKSGFSTISRAFKSNPTIERYVELRRHNPDEEFEVAISSGLEWLFANENTLAQFDIPPDLVASCLDVDSDSISELSLRLMELLIERRKAEKAGETHLASRGKAINDGLVNFLINMMLDAMDWNDDLYISRDLIVLIRQQIGGGKKSAIEKQQKAHDLKVNVVWVAAQLLETNGKISIRKISSILKVNPSTVSRMFMDGELEKESSMMLESKKFMSGSETPFADSMAKYLKNNSQS